MAFKREIILISGPRYAGKTNLCLNLLEKFKSRGITAKGIISPGLFNDDRKIAILARDVATGEECQFAKYSLGWDIERPEREWRFLSKGVSWANSRLKRAVPTDILFIDEIGYLELEEQGGWTAAIEILDEGSFKFAFLVIRPDLLGRVKERWKVSKTFIVKQGDDIEELSSQIIRYLVERA